MKTREKIKEVDLALAIIKYFELKGYESYKEVMALKNSRRADCYFVKKNDNGDIIEGIAVETKTTFCLKVMEQATKWVSMANMVYIGIPKGKRKDRFLRKFGYDICSKHLKIGILELDNELNVTEIFLPEYNNNPKYPNLYDEQKLSEAGNNKGEYFTPFKKTISLIHEYMTDKETVELKTLIKEIPHHYSSNQSAISSLKSYFGTVIPEYKLITENKKIFITRL